EVLHRLNLLIAVVLFEGSFPDHLDLGARGGQFVPRLEGPGVDGLPKLVGGALGNDCDRQRLVGCRGQRTKDKEHRQERWERVHGTGSYGMPALHFNWFLVSGFWPLVSGFWFLVSGADHVAHQPTAFTRSQWP